MTRLLPIEGFGPDGVVGTSSSLEHFSLLLTSLPLPSFVLLCWFPVEFEWLSEFSLATPERTIFQAGWLTVLVALGVDVVCWNVILKAFSFGLDSLTLPLLSMECTCLITLGALFRGRTFTNPIQYEATWLSRMLFSVVIVKGLTVRLKFMLKFIGKTSHSKEMLILIIACISDRNVFILLNCITKVTLVKDRSFPPS